MSKSFFPAVLGLVCAVACGGTTDGSAPLPGVAGSVTGGSSSGGSSAGTTGGSEKAGAPSAGSAGTGGSAAGTGGSAAGAGGSTAGGMGAGSYPSLGGTSGNGGGGGSAGVDSRCPGMRSTGACTVEQTDALCNYDSSGCLCSVTNSAPSQCVKVEPTCATGGAANSPAPDPSGGNSAKIAIISWTACRCSGGAWQCSP